MLPASRLGEGSLGAKDFYFPGGPPADLRSATPDSYSEYNKKNKLFRVV
jgi:hypothetical protein